MALTRTHPLFVASSAPKPFSRALLLLLLAAAVMAPLCAAASIRGTITTGRGVAAAEATGDVVVWLFRLTEYDGALLPLSSRDLYATDGDVRAATTVAVRESGRYTYAFEDVPAPGNYSVLGFQDIDGSGMLTFSEPEPMGWHADWDHGCLGGSSDVCTTPVSVQSAGQAVTGVDFELAAPTFYPHEERSDEHGRLRIAHGDRAVLTLWGTPAQRGYAHGRLIAEQIMDMFEFFLLENRIRSRHVYTSEFLPAVHERFSHSASFAEEVAGVVAGMEASGADICTSLGRNITFDDIVALNAYGDAYSLGVSTAAHEATSGGACTQFAFWSNSTGGADGPLIAARNMDGETDPRKVTASHVLIFAHAPTEDAHRFAHVMWPGFVGVGSGFNENGLSTMDNCGCPPPPPPANDNPVLGSVIRHLMLTRELSGDSITPDAVKAQIESRVSTAGGPCVSGCILFCTMPYTGQPAPAFVYEGDRYGGSVRLPGAVRPRPPEHGVIMASNHYWQYNTDWRRPDVCNKYVTPSFSSRWRYEAGQDRAEATLRCSAHAIGVDEVKEFLRIVSHGSTEHSIIFHPAEMRFAIAVAGLDAGVWDAPDMEWSEFTFEELFTPVPGRRVRARVY